MEQNKIQWRNGFLWLLLLAPMFFILYGWANEHTAALPQEKVKEIVYSWEKHIPFLPFTIFPYWSIDLLYGLSLFLPMTKFVQRQHALRLLAATPIAVFFFFLFPMTFSTPKPECSGIWESLFNALMGFDKPYNQSPSLHIILLVILWRIYLPHLNKTTKLIWNFWCLLIGISVLTTFQHHFIDIPTGFLTGVLICYIFPLSKKHVWRIQQIKSKSLALIYLISGIILLLLAFLPPIYISLILIWIGSSFIFIGIGYLGQGGLVFQKNENGSFSFAANILFFPYRCIIRLIRSIFFKSYETPQKITEKLFLGALWMNKNNMYDAVFDVCSEYKTVKKTNQDYISYPLIDLATPTLDEIKIGVKQLDQLIQNNKTTFIHCALGISRSTAIVFAWLMFSKRISSLEDGFNLFKQNNYQFHLSKKHKQLLQIYSKTLENDTSRN
ncbi:MAG: phosphatase PAP2/dual specificity phosphatase family protein [Flavobacterium sp.]|uniref:phosphatase PAP2/dual specificity phosphatase family protein n=1 Tax=Flavobacterium sp. TaxID=239 RepID=UPI002FC7826E